jgi:hypothetical protein
MDDLTKKTEWQRERAMMLQNICSQIKAQVEQKVTMKKAMQNACKLYAGTLLGASGNERPLKLSVPNLRRLYKEWQASGETIDAFELNYVAGKARVPTELVHEYQRLSSLPGQRKVSVAYGSLVRRWANGESIPGLGTWTDWWRSVHPGLTLPVSAPEFPYSQRAMLRYKPKKAIHALGSKGVAAFKRESVHITRTTANLRPCELFVMDDKRVDMLVINDETGKVCGVTVYIMMEVSSRRVVGFTARPADAINASDVDALIARALETEGYGNGYTTHILLERGTVAMSPAAQQLIESATDGAVKIHRTSMDAGSRALGFAPDKPSGHWQGKGVIESFMGKLDLMLMHLPGQRGNKYENQPANLTGSQRRKEGEVDTVISGGEAGEAESLAQVELTADRKLGLDCGLLWLSEFNVIFRNIIKEHNASRDHGYEGFGSTTLAEVAPGVWEDVA